MKLELIELKTPTLEFGGVGNFSDPKQGLVNAGPFDLRFGVAHLKEIRIGLIGTTPMMNKAISWLNKCNSMIPSTMKNTSQYPNFDGFENIFRAKLVYSNLWSHELKEDDIYQIMQSPDDYARFEQILNLYNDGLMKLASIDGVRPNVILCCIDEDTHKSCSRVEKKLTSETKRIIRKAQTNQLSLFEEPLEEQPEDLLYRDFRRALKAKAILAKIPIQIGTDKLFIDSSSNQDDATRAWNFSVSVYYKSGGIPWRLKTPDIETCFVGITFHHVSTNKKSLVKSCIAQGFSSDGEGFALRGGDVESKANKWDKSLHLSKTQAYELGSKILKEYSDRTGANPQKVVLHKTSSYNDDEEEGFRSAFINIPVVELINFADTNFRLLKNGMYPVDRGTLCLLNEKHAYLFHTGYMKELSTYPGAHIPHPVEIISNETVDFKKVAEDILGLARMNWNTASITGGQPVTISFSRQVGGIMSELNIHTDFNKYETTSIPTSFRFYV